MTLLEPVEWFMPRITSICVLAGRGRKKKIIAAIKEKKSDRSREHVPVPRVCTRQHIREGRRESRTESVHGGNRKISVSTALDSGDMEEATEKAIQPFAQGSYREGETLNALAEDSGASRVTKRRLDYRQRRYRRHPDSR